VPTTNREDMPHSLWSIKVILEVLLVIVSFETVQNDLEDRVHVSDILGDMFYWSSSIRDTRDLNHCQLFNCGLKLQTEYFKLVLDTYYQNSTYDRLFSTLFMVVDL